MPHIPDDRLHAYLDQALDRLESGAIESHLAECAACRAERDAIITLRDRTTALLARAAWRHSAGPPFATIRALSDQRRRLRQQRIQRAAWAASLVMALGAGWSASWYTHEHAPRSLASAPSVTVAPQPAAAARPAVPAPATVLATAPVAQPATPDTSAPPSASKHLPSRHGRSSTDKPHPAHSDAQLANVGSIPKDAQLENGGVWRTVSWAGAQQAAAHDAPPRIAGLPVMEVQVQGGDSGKRPLMVVAQQLASGEVVRTIEGPAADVSALLGTRPSYVSGESTTTAVPTTGEPRAALGTALALRRGDRMVAVTGSMSRDSLKAMMQRLNLMKR